MGSMEGVGWGGGRLALAVLYLLTLALAVEGQGVVEAEEEYLGDEYIDVWEDEGEHYADYDINYDYVNLDRDTDGDGLRDHVDDPDEDNDGIPDIQDDDDDGDGVKDREDSDWFSHDEM